jgi:hypothetical protein
MLYYRPERYCIEAKTETIVSTCAVVRHRPAVDILQEMTLYLSDKMARISCNRPPRSDMRNPDFHQIIEGSSNLRIKTLAST